MKTRNLCSAIFVLALAVIVAAQAGWEWHLISTTMMRTQKNLRDAGITASLFAQVVNVPPSSMREMFRGVQYAGGHIEANFYALSCKLLELVHAIAPLTCADPEALKKLLDQNPTDLRSWREKIFPNQE